MRVRIQKFRIPWEIVNLGRKEGLIPAFTLDVVGRLLAVAEVEGDSFLWIGVYEGTGGSMTFSVREDNESVADEIPARSWMTAHGMRHLFEVREAR